MAFDNLSPQLYLLSFKGDNDDDSAGDQDVGYGVEIDWWTLGIVAYELIYKGTPFEIPAAQSKQYSKAMGQNILFNRIRTAEPKLSPSFVIGQQIFTVSPLLSSFVRGLLEKDPSTRLGDDTVLNHPFLQAIDMEKLKAREIKSYISVEPFNRNKLSKYIQKEKSNQNQLQHNSVQKTIPEENLAGFSYAQPGYNFT